MTWAEWRWVGWSMWMFAAGFGTALTLARAGLLNF
jgi:hypothetical protein